MIQRPTDVGYILDDFATVYGDLTRWERHQTIRVRNLAPVQFTIVEFATAHLAEKFDEVCSQGMTRIARAYELDDGRYVAVVLH